MKNKEYYVATDLKSMESEIFTVKSKVAEYLSISVKTIDRGLKNDWRIYKLNHYLICRTSITKLSNRIDNLNK
jgi:hypothetical protein